MRRRVRFLKDMDVMILANHRSIPPYGLAGGADGATGRNWLERADGSRVEMSGTDRIRAKPGDTFVIETPGGGGFGTPDTRG